MSKTITRKYIQRITKREGNTNIRQSSGGGGGGGGGASQYWVEENYISKLFFNQLFTVYDEDGNVVEPNDTESVIASIKSMFGFWTDAYLSALGNGEGGGAELTLASLADVDVHGVANGQALVYDAYTQKWVPGQAGLDPTSLWQELGSLGTEQISSTHLTTALSTYNPTNNFKTVNGNSIIGTGDINVGGGGGAYLPLSGGTVTGHVTIYNNTSRYVLEIDKGSGQTASVISFNGSDSHESAHIGTTTNSFYLFNYQAYKNIGENGNTYLSLFNDGRFSIGSGGAVSGTDSDSRFFIAPNGNVGIGTTNPAFYFCVYKNQDVWHGVFGGSQNGYNFRIGGNAGKYTTIGSYYGEGNVGSNLCIQRDGGKVGIGTTTFMEKLSIDAGANLGGMTINAGTYPYILLYCNGVLRGQYGYDINQGIVIYNFVANSGLSIDNNGFVGIGTAPSYKLHVAGVAYASTGFYSGGYVTALSDARHKDVKGDVGLTVREVANAPAVKFVWKDRRQEGLQVGSIAQYWQKVMPEAIVKNADGELTMSYGVIALLASIATARKVEDHERRISELEEENKKLKKQLNAA